MSSTNRRDYDTAASQVVQSDFDAIACRLLGLIEQRHADVNQAMAAYEADGVSEEHRAKEMRWNQCATQVKHVIATMRQSLADSDDIALQAQCRAQAAVDGIV